MNCDISDEVLARRVQEGSKEDFGELVVRYEPKMMRYANRFLGGYEDRQDAVQDVFLKAYKNIRSFDTEKPFSPWIYRIAHNTFVNVIRSHSREKVSFVDMDTLFGMKLTDENAAALRENAFEREVLEQSLEKMSPKYREVLVLFYFEEKSYDEIAEILHIPKATVGVRLVRARERMGEIYKQLV